MSNQNSDKPLVLKTIFSCLLVIAIWYILFATISHQVASNFRNTIYVIGVIVLGILFIISSIWAYYVADDTAYDNLSRAIVIAITVAILGWAGGWVVGSNEKVAPGSPQMEDVR